MTHLAFIDTETTGLHREEHEIWELALIIRDHPVPEWDGEYLWQFQPTHLETADPFALNISKFWERSIYFTSGTGAKKIWIHGTTAVFQPLPSHGVSDRVSILDQIRRLTQGAHLVGAIPSFDEQRLWALMRANGLPSTWHYHIVDIEAAAAGFIAARNKWAETADFSNDPKPPWKSTDLMAAIGVDPTPEDQHTALGDARWAEKAYDAIFG
jgi:hypothetical protein